MITVAGGSGLLGRHVVAGLLDRGEDVRVLVRDAARARLLLGDRVKVVAGDVRKRDGLSELVSGASVVISAVHGFLGARGAGPVAVDQRGNAHLIDAARVAGADVVLVSVLGASPDSPLDLFRAKHAAEVHVRGSGTRWTIIRPAAFLETWLTILTRTAGSSGRPVIFGRGLQPIQFVSVLDVAAVVSRAATDPAQRGHVLEVTGVPITMTDLARALQDARGWRGSPRHVPRPLLHTLSVLARPLNPAFARQNQTALAMDTGASGVDTHATPVDPSQRSLTDVLARFTASSGPPVP